MLIIVILAVCAFLLGSCPFSFWIGKLAVNRDIRQYGDGNPGSANVFKAGAGKWGVLALVLDLLKGTPFVILGKAIFALSQPYLYMIALAAVLGHAFSPFLGFRGGKSYATFGGTLFALGQWDILISMAVLLILGFLFIGNDAWTVLISCVGTLCFLVLAHKDIWEITFLGCMTLLVLIKNYREFRMAGDPGRLLKWLRSRRKAV